MDIALCCIEEVDDTHVKVEFTGAKRSLYYIAKGSHELKELKGDRKSIGGFRRRKVAFTKSEVILEKGSKIYLTTDGYGDQHGPNTIKIGSKRVQMLLEQYAHLSMEAQANAMLDYLYQHQKGVQQRDDMLILGITI
ncbi:MAG TPA: hypothetical protein DCM08_00340 [Microscillaceae bacterium]|nr:hypothetical protein [Microscillaceae bacterium]